MSEKTSVQTATLHPHSLYSQRAPMPNTAFSHFNSQGLNIVGPGALTNMTNLKATLPSPSNTEFPPNGGRMNQNNPFMVLPSGQTVPVSAFFPPTKSNNEQVPYTPNGVYPSFIGNQTLATGGMGNYNWNYGVPTGISDLDPARRMQWTSHDDNTPMAAINNNAHPDMFQGYQLSQANGMDGQTYIAGPIQPMKTKDNKGYEMVNIDELVSRDPPIPHAVPALWTNQEDLSLAKCLQNPEGITNIYIRGFMPDTRDEDLHHWASRFGEIESCKAIIEQETGKCKGFGFVLYYSPAAAENCIRGFFHLGFQASYAQKSRNARLKDLEDKASTNIYCTGVPMDWNEADLAKHFLPYRAVSTKICRDSPSGVSKEVGFARFETREIAERVIREYHSLLTEHDGIKLFLRFADTKAQKQLKQQSQERRNWRSREYSYSVEHTPSPTLARFHNVTNGISPSESYRSPADASNNNFTPATSVSPPEIQVAKQVINNSTSRAMNATWPMQGGLQSITNNSTARTAIPVAQHAANNMQVPAKVDAIVPIKEETLKKTPSPKKLSLQTDSATGKENIQTSSPQTVE